MSVWCCSIFVCQISSYFMSEPYPTSRTRTLNFLLLQLRLIWLVMAGRAHHARNLTGLTASGYVQAVVRVPVIAPNGVRFSFQGESIVLVCDALSRVLHVRDSCHFNEPLLLGYRVLAIAKLWPYSRPGPARAAETRHQATRHDDQARIWEYNHSCMALGGSTNAVLHLLAMAHSVDVPLSIDDCQTISDRTPVIADLKPSGKYVMEDIHKVGHPFFARSCGYVVCTRTCIRWNAVSLAGHELCFGLMYIYTHGCEFMYGAWKSWSIWCSLNLCMCMEPDAMDTHVFCMFVCASALHMCVLHHEMAQTRFGLVQLEL